MNSRTIPDLMHEMKYLGKEVTVLDSNGDPVEFTPDGLNAYIQGNIPAADPVTATDVTVAELTSAGGNLTVSGTLAEVLKAILDEIDPEV